MSQHHSKTLEIYGSSDDLIEIEGDLREEFYSLSDDTPQYLVFTCGTVIKVIYDGDWYFHPTITVKGTAVRVMPAGKYNNYSEVIEITGDIKWVALTDRMFKL